MKTVQTVVMLTIVRVRTTAAQVTAVQVLAQVTAARALVTVPEQVTAVTAQV
jgi:hypothetical protein